MDFPDIPDGTTKAEAALLYARAGIPVFPCHHVLPDGSCSCASPDCTPKQIGKHPMTSNGHKWATTDETAVTSIWKANPDANIGSPLDADTIATDCDNYENFQTSGIPFPTTGPLQITGGSTKEAPRFHAINHLNGHAITKLAKYRDLGIETKGLGLGYILLAPSNHLSGGVYRWVRTGPTEPLSGALGATLATERAKSQYKTTGKSNIHISGGPCENWCDSTGPIHRNPGGYQYLNDLAFHLVTYHRIEKAADIADQLLLALDRMDPPYAGSTGRGEVDRVVRQIMSDIAAGKIGPDGTFTRGDDPVPDAENINIGVRTVFDLPFGDPPDPIVPPFLDPEEPTVVYGPGGTGKGYFASWLAILARRARYSPMILDYESHEREWGSRIRNLGASSEEMLGIHYRNPWAPEWGERRGVLIEVADIVRVECDRIGADLLIIDSYLPAAGSSEAMGGQAGALDYFGGLARIGRPSLTIAHVAAGGPKFPDKPYGSIFVHNLARETWAVEQLDVPEVAIEPGTIHIQPTVLALELRNKKRATSMKTKPQFITFSFFPDGHIEVDRTDSSTGSAKRAASDLAIEVLTGAPKPLTYDQIVKAILDSTGEVVSQATLRAAFSRGKAKGLVEMAGKTAGGRESWRLNP